MNSSVAGQFRLLIMKAPKQAGGIVLLPADQIEVSLCMKRPISLLDFDLLQAQAQRSPLYA